MSLSSQKGGNPSSSVSSTSRGSASSAHPDLTELEERLRTEVDEDFFEDPKTFRTLHRVIDVLGAQLLDQDQPSRNSSHHNNAAAPNQQRGSTEFENLHKSNPAYLALRRQQQVVEEAIEHMAVAHCADLNSSVVAVGKVARQFTEAVTTVRSLRRQVRDIKTNLGSDSANPNEPGANATGNNLANHGNNNGAKSLRELWLKKLECEAVLSLLNKLEIIREAPASFDALVQPVTGPCRICSAVLLLSNAITTMFMDDVAQVRALDKILHQLMQRKERAELIIWEILQDVLYLRTGNDPLTDTVIYTEKGNNDGEKRSSTVGSGSSGRSLSTWKRSKNQRFVSAHRRAKHQYSRNASADTDDAEEDSISDDSASFYSDDVSLDSGKHVAKHPSSSLILEHRSSGQHQLREQQSSDTLSTSYNVHCYQGRLLSRPVMETELDLEADEIRCLEDLNLPFGASSASTVSNNDSNLPRYTDPVLALRILVEALAKLGRLADVESNLSSNVEREIRKIAGLEQVATFARLERRKNKIARGGRKVVASRDSILMENEEKLKDFKLHLIGLLTAFGSVMLRLTHLAQILRHRVASDTKVAHTSSDDPSSLLHTVLVTAHVAMQREIKSFLRATLHEDKAASASRKSTGIQNSMDTSTSATRVGGISTHERGIFSLDIISDSQLSSMRKADGGSAHMFSASKNTITELPSNQFVATILFPKTNTTPQVRHALAFRRSIAVWTLECSDLKKELATVTGEDTSSPVYNATTEETALEFLDNVIKNTLLPMLQDEAVNGTVSALERMDAFEPIIDSGMYSRSSSNYTPEVQMCAACQELYNATGPLFAAMFRLPRGGVMFSPLVAVLEHSILTFISRVKQRVLFLCRGKKSFVLLEGGGPESKTKTPFSSIIEMRKPYLQLVNAYFENDDMNVNEGVEAAARAATIGRGMIPLSPSVSDTKARNADERLTQPSILAHGLDVGTDLQREQEVFEREVSELHELLNFTSNRYGEDFYVCNEDELMKAACLAHSLLKVSSLLEERLKPKGVGSISGGNFEKHFSSTRALLEAIKTVRMHGLRMAKFCRVDMIIQTLKRMSKICKSTTLVAKDAARLPSCVNDLGEHLTTASDIIREAAGNKIAAYTFSSLEQYIPMFLMQTVRIIACREGLPQGSGITLNGIEALDRSGSVLYRDLKGATSFEGSFWDDEIAADAFERSASYVAMIELEMEELVSFCRNNRSEFSDDDYKLMFSMDGPRRKGDIGRYSVLKDKMGG